MTRTTVLAAAAALALPAAPAAAAQVTTSKSPKMPNSTASAKRCGSADRNGFALRVYVTKGRDRITCRAAHRIVRRSNPTAVPGCVFFDWTKGGNGPWSDVYARRDGRAVIGAILRG